MNVTIKTPDSIEIDTCEKKFTRLSDTKCPNSKKKHF